MYVTLFLINVKNINTEVNENRIKAMKDHTSQYMKKTSIVKLGKSLIFISYLVQYALNEHAGDDTASSGEGGSQGQSLWDKYKSLDVIEIINDMFFEGISLEGQDEENHEEEEEHMEEEDREEQEQDYNRSVRDYSV